MGRTWCFITIHPCKINTMWNSKHPIEWYNQKQLLISKSEYHLIILVSFYFFFSGHLWIPNWNPSLIFYVIEMRTSDVETRCRGEGICRTNCKEITCAELSHEELLLAWLPAVKRHLPVQDRGVFSHCRKQIQCYSWLYPWLGLWLHALSRRIFHRY